MIKEIEDRLISLIRRPEDIGDLVMCGISDESFVLRREVFEFINKYNQQYGGVPSKAIVENQFEDFKFLDVPETERKYLIDELKKREMRATAIKILSKGSDLLLQDPNGAIDFIIGKLNTIRKKVVISKNYYDGDALARYQEFLERRDNIASGRFIGIRTGLSPLDNYQVGWSEGDLISIVGRPTAGKSWLLEYVAGVAYIEGKRVLYISPEMPIKPVSLRLDTIISALTGEVLENKALMLGNANAERYKDFLTSLALRRDWLTIDSDSGRAFTLGSIQAAIDDFKPDLVAVDGFLLLKQDVVDNSWRKDLEMAYGLKGLAQNNKIVCVVVAQASKKAANDMPEMTEVYGGDALVQASDFAIMMEKDEEKAGVRYITIPKIRGREALTQRTNINFDVNRGIIGV